MLFSNRPMGDLSGGWAGVKALVRDRIVRDPHVQLFGEYHYRVPTDRLAVALTYDDGPLEPFSSALLDRLGELGVPATFFCIGRQLERFPETARRALAEGHELGNHSYSHVRLVRRPLTFVRTEIERTNGLLRGLGVRGEIFFRAPYGYKLFAVPYVLRRLGMRHILFDFFSDPTDWTGAPDAVVGSMLDRVRPGSILLLHDGNPNAARHVVENTERIVAALRARGYAFATVGTLLAERQRSGV